MRSTVFDRFKKSGLMTSSDGSHGMKMAPSSPPSMTVPPPEEPAKASPREGFPPSSEDEPEPSDPAEEESGHHGTMDKPVDLVSGKLIIRLDDGQLYELKKLQNQGEEASFEGGY